MRKAALLVFFILSMSPFSFSQSNIKEPNVSGQFYTSNAQRLAQEVDAYISAAKVPSTDKNVEIIIAPHAGYMYSGHVAGHSFKSVQGKSFKTIVVIAPSHFFGFDGVSVWKEGGFKTPLGTIPVDAEFTQRLISANEKFYFEPQAFSQEHALEVELPFLQKTFSDFKIVPLVMGQPSFETCEALAKTLKEVIGDRQDVLIVVSTDLSHYHDDATARKMDEGTLATVKSLDPRKLWDNCRAGTMEMCGCVPTVTALIYANLKGLKDVEILKYANSGDVTGDKEKVVGYSSIAISGDSSVKKDVDEGFLNQQQKKRLIEIARKTLEEYVRTGKTLEISENDPRLLEEEGAFVTLHRTGQLRGCIGNVLGRGPLYQTVRDMAIAAASEDPRFPAVAPEELAQIEVEVSVLSKPRRVKSADEIKMGVHGVIVSRGAHHGLFLPQVATETGWSKERFLSELCAQKAGLPADAWKDPQTILEVFTAQVFSEKDGK